MRRIAQYVFYFFVSVKNRGLIFTFRLIFNEVKWERKLGISTLQIENFPAEIINEEFYHYQGASYYILQHMFDRIPKEVRKGAFIDYGCGKGRAMIMAAVNGFKNVQGIDLSEKLISIARTNISQCKQLNLDADFIFHCENAETFVLPPAISLVYLFNPFGESVMKKVVEACVCSANNTPREFYVLYINPKHLDCWLSAFDTVYTLKSKKYNEAVLLKYRKPESILG